MYIRMLCESPFYLYRNLACLFIFEASEYTIGHIYFLFLQRDDILAAQIYLANFACNMRALRKSVKLVKL